MGVSLSLQAAGRGRPEDTRAQLDEIANRTRVITRSLRSLLNSIYPLAVPEEGWEFGLDDSIEALRETGVLVTVQIADVKLTPVEELLLLRVGREALRNVYAHAAAREVAVTFDVHRHRPRLTIADDGLGFGRDVAQAQRNDGHLGLALMHDLADELDAHLEIVSAPGRGTNVILTLRETT